MLVYAGIDEAGYGPFFGPLVVGRCVLAIPRLDGGPGAEPPRLWQRLSKAVCRNLNGRKGRIVVNDSKKLRTASAGIKHLELGCLAFAALAARDGGPGPADAGDWLDALGETCHRDPRTLPWYAAAQDAPWQTLPVANTAGEIAVARGMLRATCTRIGVEMARADHAADQPPANGGPAPAAGCGDGFGAAVVFEHQFNHMLAATRSKAAVSFTQVARHLDHVWRHHGRHHPIVVVDRQGGRSLYRELLAQNFAGCDIAVLQERPACSTYEIRDGRGRAMTVSFEVEAEQRHMPVALASMCAKYTRELMMARFNAWFAARCPQVKPTAGYGTDGKRFWQDIRPRLPQLRIEEQSLLRQA